MAEISHFADHSAHRYAHIETPRRGMVTLAAIPARAWRALAAHAAEPNAYQSADWAQAIAASARDGAGANALTAWSGRGEAARLIGVIPVISMWRAYRLPLPALVNADPHTSLGTPLFDRDDGIAAAAGLLRNARDAGAHALLLRHVTIDGPTMQMVREATGRDGLAPLVLQSHTRALLDATRDADDVLLEALGAKKLKDLRRLRNRMAEHGAVGFAVARTAAEIDAALLAFLDLEASGWKGARGTALKQHDGDLAFIRRATSALAERGECEIVTLRAGETPVAAGIVLRHLDRAFYFKIGVDPAFAKYSVGVQLTLDLTRHLCADPTIAAADSTAAPGHSMIDPLWRGRLGIGDVLVPLRRHDPAFALIRGALTARFKARALLKRAMARAGK